MGRLRLASLLPFLLLPILIGSLTSSSFANPLRETLSNGLEVFVLENPGTASLSVDLWVRAGSRYESSKNNGISHFVEHLLFKGTSKRTAKDISRQIAAVGGSMNASTHWEYTQLHISLLPQHLGLALEILADVAQDSLMTEEMIAKERKVVLEEISLANIYPPSYVLNIVSRTLFPECPLGLPICGTKETVQGIQRNDLIEFYKRYYVPNNGFLTVVGNVDPRAAQAMIEEKFNAWPKGHCLSDSLLPPLRQSKQKEVRQRKFLTKPSWS